MRADEGVSMDGRAEVTSSVERRQLSAKNQGKTGQQTEARPSGLSTREYGPPWAKQWGAP